MQSQTDRTPRNSKLDARPLPGRTDTEELISGASEEDLALALRLVAWNPRDLGQFLKQRRAR